MSLSIGDTVTVDNPNFNSRDAWTVSGFEVNTLGMPLVRVKRADSETVFYPHELTPIEVPYESAKFNDDKVSEFLYRASLTGEGESSGNNEAPCGWFAAFAYPDIESAQESCDADDLAGEIGVVPADLVGYHIIGENEQGFVGREQFDSEADMDKRYQELERAYAAWGSRDEE